MGVKQDAWDAEIAAFDAARPAYEIARDALLAQWATFNSFLDGFLTGPDVTQEDWDAQVLALRQATITKAPRYEGGLMVRPPETQASFSSELSPLLFALDELAEMAFVYEEDPGIPNNVKARLRRLPFKDDRISFSPAGVTFQVRAENGTVRTVTINAPQWWLLPNQFSDFIIRGRVEPRLGDNVANARQKLAVRINPTLDDSNLFALRDDCAAITGID